MNVVVLCFCLYNKRGCAQGTDCIKQFNQSYAFKAGIYKQMQIPALYYMFYAFDERYRSQY